MPEQYQLTELWNRTLSHRDNDPFEEQRERLRSTYISFRSKAASLTQQISSSLPDLTIHDVSHLDALWETASLIAGSEYPLNPLEAFVLGGAILLHDAALCFEAYEGGLEGGIRRTLEWRDAVAAETDRNPDASEDERKSAADFSALRFLHAKQAKELATRAWIDPNTQQTLYLIENQNLRQHLGQLIGEIASSHHWDIEDVGSKLPPQVNALPDYPTSWRINPIKIACLLRCADATHIDQRRAPDFLHAMARRQGISGNHWLAQNWLGRVDSDMSDPNKETLIFTSTREFTEDQADAWWVAYDAIQLVGKELTSANALLESLRREDSPPFKMRRVRGAGSPELLKEHVRVEAWTPISAHLHVGNIEHLVKMLGGEELYGKAESVDHFNIVLRELLQNARDSVAARRAIEPGFEGKILVRLRREEEDDTSTTWLDIEDDGVGMSERVLTGPLLDFGTSFWASSLVRSEFPGLQSSSYTSIGKFGIGFYSVFMIADQVVVSSRRWDEGLDKVRQLVFGNGLTFRPLLRTHAPSGYTPAISTRVSCRIKSEKVLNYDEIEIKRNRWETENLIVNLDDYLASLSVGIDVNVFLSQFSHGEEKSHNKFPIEPTQIKPWLLKASLALRSNEDDHSTFLDQAINRMRFIVDNDKKLGLAALSTEIGSTQELLGLKTVGGFSSSALPANHSDSFIGIVECLPGAANRAPGDFKASHEALRTWGADQIEMLKGEELQPVQLYAAASNLASFKIDPYEIAHFPVIYKGEVQVLPVTGIVNNLRQRPGAFLHMKDMAHADGYNTYNSFGDMWLFKPLKNTEYLSLEFGTDGPEKRHSFISCLHREILRQGYTPIWQAWQNVATNGLGVKLSVLVISLNND